MRSTKGFTLWLGELTSVLLEQVFDFFVFDPPQKLGIGGGEADFTKTPKTWLDPYTPVMQV